MRRLNKVIDWYDTKHGDDQHPLLYEVFTPCAIFNHIYLPVKTPTVNGMPDEFTYTDIGMDAGQLAETYSRLFGANYLIEPITTEGDYAVCIGKLARRIEAVFRLNLNKYYKLIELQGYTYNPLWNVDGNEEYTYLENSGVNDISTSKDNASYNDTETGTVNNTYSSNRSLSNTDSRTSFESTTARPTNSSAGTDNVSNGTDNDTFNKTYGHGAHKDTDTTTITHHNADNNGAEYSGGTDAFGNTVIGGDKYHTERKVRQGNIGVTKTQELIEAERNNLRFSIIYEFFKDINEQILVGIY